MPDDDDGIVELRPGARARLGLRRNSPGDPGGRIPTFVPTDEQRHTVMVLSANDVRVPIIAQALRINEKTLAKHFRKEMDLGREHITARVGYAVVKEALAGNIAAARYWLSTHGGKAWQAPREALPDPSNPTDDSVVHFFMPSNNRDKPEIEEGVTIDGAAEVEDATGTDDA